MIRLYPRSVRDLLAELAEAALVALTADVTPAPISQVEATAPPRY